MAILFSTEFGISPEILVNKGVFNVFVDEDSPFFINIKRLQNCTVPEFSNSYEKINERFHQIGILLKSAKPGDKLYKTALSKFDFPEVNGINLGFSEGTHGAGFGFQLRKQIIKDAYEIIQSGSDQPEIFHLVSLFEDNVGPDRLSDMIARILYQNIVAYSKRIYVELGINENTYPNYRFKDGLLINPYKKYYLLLLPEAILHELPIARCWDDIDRVCSENAAIRAEVNEAIGEEWRKLPSTVKKEYLREQVFKIPEKAERIITAYKEDSVDEINVFRNIKYTEDYLRSTYELPESTSQNSYDASLEILDNFKKWVEFHRGNTVINGVSQKPSEKIVQHLIHAVALMYCGKFNWDFSPETDSGRGPVDFKISRGTDKTVIEVKLTSNQQCVHGFEVQIEEYAKAENTFNKIFVIVDTGINSGRVRSVRKKQEEMIDKGLSPATIVEVDAVPKQSASKY